MENIEQMSLLEVAVKIMEQKGGICNIKDLIKEVLEAKGIDASDPTFTSQLYVDITTSSKFVFMGDENWDLKSRQSLDEFNKDGSAFNSKEDYVDEDDLDDEEDDLDLDEEENDEEDEDEDEDDDKNSMYVPDDDYDEDEDEESDLDEDEDDDIDDGEELERYSEDDEDFDEDKYNDLMDDYEGMYDKN